MVQDEKDFVIKEASFGLPVLPVGQRILTALQTSDEVLVHRVLLRPKPRATLTLSLSPSIRLKERGKRRIWSSI